MRRYFKIWWIFTRSASQIAFVSRFGAVVFILGKFLRLAFFILFLAVLGSRITTISGFSLWQMIFFFLTYNLVDTLPQFFFREVYRFRSYVVSGDFDYILIKPISPLFRSLFGGSDILDFSILFILTTSIIFTMGKIGAISSFGVALYILLIFNGLIIATALHILVLGVGILTTEVDNTIMLYRDITQMGRVPVDIYLEPLRGFLTFAIPVGVMMTFPAKAMMNLLSLPAIILAFLLGFIFLWMSLKFWRFSLRHYSSASS